MQKRTSAGSLGQGLQPQKKNIHKLLSRRLAHNHASALVYKLSELLQAYIGILICY